MKKYKNILFDFGNVLGVFRVNQLLQECCGYDDEHLREVIFHDWDLFDAGMYSNEEYIQSCLELANVVEKEAVKKFFNDWFYHLHPIDEMHDWIVELKEKGYRLYILSNAPVIFEKKISHYPIVKLFDGCVFSGSIRLAKPDVRIYQHLLDKYDLKAKECFFIDDKVENIEGAFKVGIDGMVYDHNLEEIKKRICRY